ncbi:MAG TPA: hypothetical protein VH062_13830 [Polyangiaceae bacterium]|jgi:hypothetical protein|nr:hypothetical protein [Polyangiaceae bacterium]
MQLRVPSLVLALLFCFLHPARLMAAPKKPDVKVCVRIEEKTWARDGAAPEPSSVPPVAPPTAAPPQAALSLLRVAHFGDLPPDAPDAKAPSGPPAGATLPEDELARGAAAPPDGAAPSVMRLADPALADYSTIDPIRYLKRLVEYHVTHEPGFESADKGCAETLVVELYSVKQGWTAFARYSGNAREEKVDVVRLDELGIFAERVTTALLRDKSVSQTLTRTTVLRADSDEHVRQIKVRTHFLLGMGSGLRLGELPTAPNATDPAVKTFRVETPLEFEIGVRNKYRGFALDATGRLDVGVGERAARLSAGGGHVDYAVGLGAGLNFLAYADPDAVNTLYYGGGGSFELSRYQSQGARARNGEQPAPSGLWGGGLDVDLVLGYEFARTSTLHFFVQATIALPAYAFDSQNSQSAINAYVPSAAFKLGLLL